MLLWPIWGVTLSMLKISGLDTGYGSTQVLRGLDLEIGEGEAVSVIGANGAGKSTLLRTISGLLAPWNGRISFTGQDITGSSPDKIFRLGIAHCPENRRIWAKMSVVEHLQLGARCRREAGSVKEDMKDVYRRFPVLYERRNSLGGELSGGQQQMLAIGRALMSHPRLLILDEPSLGLAPLIIEDVAKAIRDIHKRGVTILLVEQNARLALKLSERAYVMETGRVVLSGTTEDLMKDPRVQQAYLGGMKEEKA